jgi:ubiquinone/menaquinone biosynthesis C-methylase UbiE
MAGKQEVQDAEYWSSRSETYERSWTQKVFHDWIHRAVLDLVARQRQPEVIVDVGCGTGKLLRKAAARWPTARRIGVDAADGMVAMARERTPGATFYVGVAESLPLPDGGADVIVSTISFHHWPDQEKGLREVARVLRPGGRFFLADIVPPFGLGKIIGHVGSNSAARFRELFAQAGLEVRGQHRRLGGWLLVTIGERR